MKVGGACAKHCKERSAVQPAVIRRQDVLPSASSAVKQAQLVLLKGLELSRLGTASQAQPTFETSSAWSVPVRWRDSLACCTSLPEHEEVSGQASQAPLLPEALST